MVSTERAVNTDTTLEASRVSRSNFWANILSSAAGGVLAGKLFGRLKADWLRRAFGVLILYGGVRAVLLL